MESGVDFVCCDNPSANKFSLHIMAALAEQERELISNRTKAGLQVIKDKIANGQEHISKAGKPVMGLGGFRGHAPPSQSGGDATKAKAQAFAEMVAPMITIMRDNGASLQAIADKLNERHVRTAQGSAWTPMAVKRVIDRLQAAQEPA